MRLIFELKMLFYQILASCWNHSERQCYSGTQILLNVARSLGFANAFGCYALLPHAFPQKKRFGLI